LALHFVQGLRQSGDHWTVTLEEGEHIGGVDQVVLAVPAYVATRILGALDESLGRMLGEIPYAPAAVVALGFQKEQISHPLDGFGFLVPGRESRPILGSLWTSSIFPGHRAPEGCALLRTIVGGARNPRQATLESDDLIRSVLGELAPLLGIEGQPVFSRIERYISAIPQYDIGHLARLADIDKALAKHPGLRLTGNAFRGVGINDCTRESFSLAECLLPDGG
jgi:oxygen-dependent protoporphyrinogen oxidase